MVPDLQQQAAVVKLIGCPSSFGVHGFISVKIAVLPSRLPLPQAAGRWFTAGVNGSQGCRGLFLNVTKKSEPFVSSLTVTLQEFVAPWEYF